MKKTPLKRRSRTKRAKLIAKLDKLCREVVMLRDNRTCQHCGENNPHKQYHCSHVVAKGVGASWRRFDLLNMKCLCARCHMWWHENPTESGAWFKKKWPHRDEYLEKYRYGRPSKITDAEMEELVETLTEKVEELE